jgi:hypothetical protein
VAVWAVAWAVACVGVWVEEKVGEWAVEWEEEVVGEEWAWKEQGLDELIHTGSHSGVRDES